jgi:hypothetical protein
METSQNDNPITGKEGEEIDLQLAASWTKNYRHKHPKETISQFFGKEILEKILAQENCLGIRFYYAHDKPLNGWQRCIVSLSNFILKVIGNVEGEKHLIITGVLSTGMDQLPDFNKSATEAQLAPKVELKTFASSGTYTLGEMSAPCPGSPGCPKNALTGN